ncbi:MAG: hypothetical protein LUG58_06820, partial [Clostridiales bacterium]|nr:hypothetical protein [Clostridiales bacterium]
VSGNRLSKGDNHINFFLCIGARQTPGPSCLSDGEDSSLKSFLNLFQKVLDNFPPPWYSKFIQKKGQNQNRTTAFTHSWRSGS